VWGVLGGTWTPKKPPSKDDEEAPANSHNDKEMDAFTAPHGRFNSAKVSYLQASFELIFVCCPQCFAVCCNVWHCVATCCRCVAGHISSSQAYLKILLFILVCGYVLLIIDTNGVYSVSTSVSLFVLNLSLWPCLCWILTHILPCYQVVHTLTKAHTRTRIQTHAEYKRAKMDRKSRTRTTAKLTSYGVLRCM